jgi:Zn-dependent peptidase ImmA (M78 family)
VSTKQFEIHRNVIEWALLRAGLSMSAAEKRAPILKNLGNEPLVRISYGQIDAVAKLTKTPLGYFFLPEPPVETLPIPDFRTFKDVAITEKSPDLIETVFLMHSRQQWYREYAAGEGYLPVSFIGSASTKIGVVELAKRIRAEFNLSAGWAGRIYSYGDAVSQVRDMFQKKGVLVVINGIVGNNTTRKLSPKEFRGFVLSDDLAPLLFVNGADFKSAQMFTLFHELVHLWIDRDGIVDLDGLSQSEGEIEVFCNRVAAEILVPGEELEVLWHSEPTFHDQLVRPAKKFKVSPIVIGRRLLELELITKSQFFTFYDVYVSGDFQNSAQSATEGGNFYNNQNNRIGKKFMQAVARATMEGKLSYTHAFRLTGLTSATFDKYVHALGGVA